MLPRFRYQIALALWLSIQLVAQALAEWPSQLRSEETAGKLVAKVLAQDKSFPYVVNSLGQDNVFAAEIYGLLSAPFAEVATVLNEPTRWCEFITLTLNVKACVYSTTGKGTRLSFYAGRKFYETPEHSYLLQYDFFRKVSGDNNLQVELRAEDGPMGTSDYRIVVEARSHGQITLFRFYSSYKVNWLSSLATKLYLSTLGADKEGFSIESVNAKGEPQYIKGYRSIIERNTIRYVLAMKVFLQDKDMSLAQRLQQWFTATEVYARQLHELEWEEYREAKVREFANQQRLQEAILHGQDIDSVEFLY